MKIQFPFHGIGSRWSNEANFFQNLPQTNHKNQKLEVCAVILHHANMHTSPGGSSNYESRCGFFNIENNRILRSFEKRERSKINLGFNNDFLPAKFQLAKIQRRLKNDLSLRKLFENWLVKEIVNKMSNNTDNVESLFFKTLSSISYNSRVPVLRKFLFDFLVFLRSSNN